MVGGNMKDYVVVKVIKFMEWLSSYLENLSFLVYKYTPDYPVEKKLLNIAGDAFKADFYCTLEEKLLKAINEK